MERDLTNNLEEQRLRKLSKEREILVNLGIELDDPAMQKDTSENDGRDALLAKISSQEKIVQKLEQEGQVAYIPGTWNIGDKLYVKYLRIVAYGKDQITPDKRVLVQLEGSVDITKFPKDQTVQEMKIVPTSINSALGKALLHKAHENIRFNTPIGYCEVEVERCLL